MHLKKDSTKRKSITEIERFWLVYRRDRVAMVGLILLISISLILIFAPLLTKFPPRKIVAANFIPPSQIHIMGTDNIGRDVFSSALYGARISLIVGIFAASTSIIIGILVGAVSGFYGGFKDFIIMKITELFQVIPRLFLAIAAVAIIGHSIWHLVWIIGLTSWPSTARLVRAEFLSLRDRPFVEAVKGLGAGTAQLVFGEILPNAFPPIIVNSSFQVARAILLEAGLSFLGLGDANIPSLGIMLYESLPFLRMAWWMSFFPGIIIAVVVLSFNTIGDGLNDALNPKLRDR